MTDSHYGRKVVWLIDLFNFAWICLRYPFSDFVLVLHFFVRRLACDVKTSHASCLFQKHT